MQDWKIAHRPDVVERLRRGDSAPVSTQLVLSDLCNQDCWYCSYRMSGYPSNHSFFSGDEMVQISDAGSPGHRNPKRQMSTEKALEILQDLQAMGVESVEFTGGGEPTIHPEFARIVLDARRRWLAVGVITNGLRLTEEILEALDGISWVRVSIDTVDRETYRRMRGTDGLPRVLINLMKIKSQHLGVNCVVTHENYTQLTQFREAIKSIVPHAYVRFGEQYTGEQYTPEMMDVIQSQLTPAEFRYFQGRIGQRTLKGGYSTCWQQRLNTYIGANLHVYRCCHYAYHPHGLLGSLEHQRFRTLWESLNLQEFDANTCEGCPFHTKNSFVEFLMGKPHHLEFL